MIDAPERVASVPRHQRSRSHVSRFLVFGVIGGGVFLAGLAMQIALVRYLHMDYTFSYIVSGIASVQLSFFLNRYLTWGDRPVGIWRPLWRFNTQKIVGMAINMGAYAVLVHLGMQYIIANLLLTAIFTPVNYLLGHYWSFTGRVTG